MIAVNPVFQSNYPACHVVVFWIHKLLYFLKYRFITENNSFFLIALYVHGLFMVVSCGLCKQCIVYYRWPT